MVVLDADLSKSTYTADFGKKFPDRFFECGIAEANMVAIGAGFASFGEDSLRFQLLRVRDEQGVRTVARHRRFPDVNLKAVGTHSGISIGEDGPSQMSIEDI